MIENVEIVEPGGILAKVHHMHDMGCRFVTITCCGNKDGSYDLIYTFDFKSKLLNVKATVVKDEAVTSVSPVYIAAAFAENEIKELFGLKFEGLILDYGGKFMVTGDSASGQYGALIIEKKGGGSNAG